MEHDSNVQMDYCTDRRRNAGGGRVFFLGVLVSILIPAAIVPGCESAQWWKSSRQSMVPAPAGTSSVHNVASKLGLEVVSSSSSCAELRSPGNSVMFFSDPRGRAFVNGRQVGQTGGIVSVGKTIYVPSSTEHSVRSALVEPTPNDIAPPKPNKPEIAKIVSGRVVIDPGHGGKDPGTTAYKIYPEKRVVLNISLAVAEILQRNGVEVILTRDKDVFITLDDRCRIANRSSSDLFVSIHADSTVSKTIRGHTILLPRSGSQKASAAGTCISRRLSSSGSRRHSIRTDTRGLRVLTKTRIPAVLVEVGFMSTPSEAKLLANSSHQNHLANAIAQGIIDHLKK